MTFTGTRSRTALLTRVAVALIGCGLLVISCGCRPLSLDDARRIAEVASWTGDNRVSIREKNRDDLWEKARIVFGIGLATSARANQYLRRYDVSPTFSRSKLDSLKQLKSLAEREPTLDKEFTLAELAFHEARSHDTMGRNRKAKFWYVGSILHSYRYLFSPNFNNYRNAYSPEFRMAVDYYNRSLENLLRIMNRDEGLKPGVQSPLEMDDYQVGIEVQFRGPWEAEDFEKFEFANDFEVRGMGNLHRRSGLGVPLIGVRRQNNERSPVEKYYPNGLAMPVTAFMRFADANCEIGTGGSHQVQCVIEFRDSLRDDNVEVGGRAAPLESDLTTPLGYFLQNPLVSTRVLETVGLLDGKLIDDFAGLYMLEPYDPNRVPVVFVHGLWSGPFTWLEMFNELRALPEIRDQYQFWFYLYPTGQPFWVSAKQMRSDLRRLRQDIDSNHQIATLDQMVLVGHSMGGLVSRLQTVDSGQAFWQILSDRPFDELEADPEIKQEISEVLFFQANPSIKRVVTIGTPHKGSEFANNFTRWLGHKLIRLPDLINVSRLNKIRNRAEIFKDPEILATKTSIDSLSPQSPFLTELQRLDSAPWVRTHNIVGNYEKRPYLGLIGELKPTGGDGIVSTENSEFSKARSHLEINAKHQEVHSHALAIREVYRILRLHSADVRRALSQPDGSYSQHRHRSQPDPVGRPFSQGLKPASFTISDLPDDSSAVLIPVPRSGIPNRPPTAAADRR